MKTLRSYSKRIVAPAALFAILAGLVAMQALGDTSSATSAPPVRQISTTPTPVSPQDAAAAIESAKSLSAAFRVTAEQVLPSVVAIESQRGPGGDHHMEFRPGGGGAKRFGPVPGLPHPRSRPPSLGTGVIIDEAGLVLTNRHVVAGAGDVTIRLYDGREYQAVDIWSDRQTDIAVVKMEGATDLVAARMGDSDRMSVGDWVLALGQPFGLESTVTAGIISGKNRGIGVTDREDFLQTDAAINPGNSGGPLVNLDGEVVGINTAISSRSGGNDGIGFAVPINVAKWVAGQLVDGGSVHRAYMGVGIQQMTPTLAEQFDVKPREGVLVTTVFADTPAAASGLEEGDVIVAYAGVDISTPNQLQMLVERSEIGRPHLLSVLRDGERIEITFTPEEQPADFREETARREKGGPADASAGPLRAFGLEIGALDESTADRLGIRRLRSGVVITSVQPHSPADRAGLTEGLVIEQVNRSPVSSLEDVQEALSRDDESSAVLLLVRSERAAKFVLLKR